MGEGFSYDAEEDAEASDEREGVGSDNGGGCVGEPEEGDGDGEAAESRALAKGGEEEEGNPGGGEELGKCGALEGAKEEIGISEIESGGNEGGVGSGKLPGKVVKGETGGGYCDEDKDGGDGGDGEDEGEKCSENPGEGWVEDKAWLAGVPGGGGGPVGIIAVAELVGGIDPVLDVKEKVVAAGAVEEKREYGEERGEGK